MYYSELVQQNAVPVIYALLQSVGCDSYVEGQLRDILNDDFVAARPSDTQRVLRIKDALDLICANADKGYRVLSATIDNVNRMFEKVDMYKSEIEWANDSDGVAPLSTNLWDVKDVVTRVLNDKHGLEAAVEVYCAIVRRGSKILAALAALAVMLDANLGIFLIPVDYLDEYDDALRVGYEDDNWDQLKAFLQTYALHGLPADDAIIHRGCVYSVSNIVSVLPSYAREDGWSDREFAAKNMELYFATL